MVSECLADGCRPLGRVRYKLKAALVVAVARRTAHARRTGGADDDEDRAEDERTKTR